MNAEVIAALTGLALLFLTVLGQTVLLVRWGSRLTAIVESLVEWRAEVRPWKHDQVTPRLWKVDELWKRHQKLEEQERHDSTA